MPITISKSKYMAGVQCLKRLYLLVHQPKLKGGMDAADFALMEQGREVGRLARQLFAGGIEVPFCDPQQAVRITRELIANPEVPAIFEAAFENGGVFVRVDILHRRRDGRWRLIEVKLTADLKEQHLDDVAIQYRVVSRSGLDLASACLAHVNRNYVYTGDDIDVWRFFRIKNLTRRVERLLPKLTFQLRSELRVLVMPNPPEIPAGPHCTNPITCEFFDRCNPLLPNDHIRYLPRLHASAAEELGEMGVESILDIPEDFHLSERQRIACTSVQTGQAWFSAELSKELESLKYPLYFADFESVNPAIPRFSGMRPFDQLLFQWSVHVQRRPETEPEHYEFLATDKSDPRREFITSLCDELGEDGSIVVYAAFESQRLSELAAWMPEFAEPIKRIQSRLWDLLPVIRNHVYHPAFAGSYSLKAVLPALVPAMTYEGMAVANGQDAGLAWESLVRGNLDQFELDKTRKALLDYCGKDTLALVRLLAALRLRCS
jgi:predicted RecB family nuclease